MKIKLEEFLPKLTLAKKVVNAKPIIEVMGSFYLHTRDGLLYVNASDVENTVSVSVKPTEYSEMNVCVNANDFHTALSNLKSGEVEFELNHNMKVIRCKYNSGFFQIPFDDDPNSCAALEIQAQDYTLEKDITDAFDFSLALTKAQIAASEENLRPVLCGIHLDMRQDGIVAVACDKHKLSKYKTTITLDGDVSGFIMQRKSANLLVSLIAESEGDGVTMRVGDRSVCFVGDGFTLSSRLTEGVYPNYAVLIPEKSAYTAVVSRNTLLSAIHHVSLMKSAIDEMLIFNFDNDNILIEAEDINFKKKAKENVPCAYSGEPMRLGIKSGNVTMILQAIDSDEVEIRFDSPQRPILFIPKDDDNRLLTLCMPMMCN